MPTIFTHPAVPIALAVAARGTLPRKMLCVGMVLSVIPDLDVIGLRLGVAYATAFGHRGFSHSIVFAVLVALLCAVLFRAMGSSFGRTFAFFFTCVMSHSLLDTFTSGGYGVALFWPLSDARFFAPWQPIEVSPLSISGFFSARGVEVLRSEILWVWFPCLAFASMTALSRSSRH